MLGLGAVFHSASNGANFKWGYRTKIPPNTLKYCFFQRISEYFLSRFAVRVELILNRIELSAEFSAKSNGTSFNGDNRSENLLIPQIVIFIGDFRCISCLDWLYRYDYF